MNLHSSTRAPVEDTYAALLGKAIYLFAYYEWTIIWIIECMVPGFVSEYSRSRSPMPSGRVKERFKEVLEGVHDTIQGIEKDKLRSCLEEFGSLIEKRNALIHAHPITDLGGEQILAFQSYVSRPIPDMKWERGEVEKVISWFDAASVHAGGILDQMRS